MSAKLLGQVLDADMGSHVRKWVLAKLCDAAEPDGTSIYPGKESIALVANCSERTVQRELSTLESSGLLILVEPARGHRPTEYRLDLDIFTRVLSEGFVKVLDERLAREDSQTSPQPDSRGDTVSPLKNDAREDKSEGEGRQIEAPGETSVRASLCDPSDPLKTPRNSASADARDERASGSAQEPTTDAEPVIDRKAAKKRFRTVCERYPKAAVDKLDKAEGMFVALPEADQQAFVDALDIVAAFLSTQKHRPPLQDFIREKRWELIPRPDLETTVAKGDEGTEVTRYSRGFWALFWRCDQAGTSPSVVIDLFRQAPKGKAVFQGKHAPSEDEEKRLWRVSVRSEQFEAWRDHAIARWPELKFSYPRPDIAQFAWMPSEFPPGHDPPESQRYGERDLENEDGWGEADA